MNYIIMFSVGCIAMYVYLKTTILSRKERIIQEQQQIINGQRTTINQWNGLMKKIKEDHEQQVLIDKDSYILGLRDQLEDTEKELSAVKKKLKILKDKQSSKSPIEKKICKRLYYYRSSINDSVEERHPSSYIQKTLGYFYFLLEELLNLQKDIDDLIPKSEEVFHTTSSNNWKERHIEEERIRKERNVEIYISWNDSEDRRLYNDYVNLMFHRDAIAVILDKAAKLEPVEIPEASREIRYVEPDI